MWGRWRWRDGLRDVCVHSCAYIEAEKRGVGEGGGEEGGAISLVAECTIRERDKSVQYRRCERVKQAQSHCIKGAID